MRMLFYISIIAAIALGVVIYIEKNKKPSNMLIEEKQQPEPEIKQHNSETHLHSDNQNQVTPPPIM